MDALVLGLPGRFRRGDRLTRACMPWPSILGFLAEVQNSLRCCFATDDRKGEVNEDGG